MVRYRYQLQRDSTKKPFELKDKNWVSYLYFHAYGPIDGIDFEVYENWKGGLSLKADKQPFGSIDTSELTGEVTILVNREAGAFLTSPDLLSLAYCMYRLYQIESTIIEELLT